MEGVELQGTFCKAFLGSRNRILPARVAARVAHTEKGTPLQATKILVMSTNSKTRWREGFSRFKRDLACCNRCAFNGRHVNRSALLHVG